MRSPFVSALFAGFLFALGASAQAQGDVCAGLAAQLARLDKSGATVDPLSDAIMRQRDSLQRGVADYQRRCQGGFFTPAAPQCPAIQAKLAEMQRNLEQLEARARGARPTSAGVPPAGEDRARILTAMRQAGCGAGRSATAGGPIPPGTIAAGPGRAAQNGSAPIVAGPGERYFTLNGPSGPQTYREDASGRVTRVDSVPRARVAAVPPSRPGGGFFSSIFGERPPGVADPDDPYARGPEPIDGEGLPLDDGGAYRTLCVRMCDGYYFPISYSTSRSRFSLDGDICRARCPGAETRLFVHKTGLDSEAAVSADDGETPYTRIPNALRYRSEVVSGCGCGRPDPAMLPVNASSDEGANSGSNTVRVGDVRDDLPIPRAKPRFDEDPDTRLNTIASFIPAPIATIRPPTAGGPGGEGNAPRSVRVVGPKFFANR
ncbi:DUF2865 domain-containing protein [Prosthecodimorpha staleyi]|uniref:DUF2865 domain-containing protein n=1 Tax=Prosthecodimorpha staleyi TaxID=2840188 RepID=A0A947D8W2_9HYPH|nr:DUF2865 domain-containing protein [Prosthecodimorpha staleyi]MBT9292538.1 DUF2865 domain-containing protein [Prosthecodimorpha staleyi]